MSDWIIRDWTGQEIESGFDSFGDARMRIEELADIEAHNNFNQDLEPEQFEELYQAVCEDLYAINVDEHGKEIPDHGQYSY